MVGFVGTLGLLLRGGGQGHSPPKSEMMPSILEGVHGGDGGGESKLKVVEEDRCQAGGDRTTRQTLSDTLGPSGGLSVRPCLWCRSVPCTLCVPGQQLS